MWIDIKGWGHALSMSESRWLAIRKIAREFGWMPEYQGKPPEQTGLFYEVDVFPEHNARILATALYRAIHEVESDCLSEPLIVHVRDAGLGNMRAVADLAAVGTIAIN
jgi:hypothetical protein